MGDIVDQLILEDSTISAGMRIIKKHTAYKNLRKIVFRQFKKCPDKQAAYDMLLYNLLYYKKPPIIQAIAVRIGIAAGYKDIPHAMDWGIETLVALAKNDVLTIKQEGDNYFVVSPYHLSPQLRQEMVQLYKFLPPMQVPPRNWDSNNSGGFLQKKSSIFVGNRFVGHDDYQNYSALNKLQRIGYTLDEEVYTSNPRDPWRDKVIQEYLDKEFYFIWQYDARGRSYTSGYHIQLQGDEYAKALLNFSRKEYLPNMYPMLIAISSHMGLDHLTWKERIAAAERAVESPETIQWEDKILGQKALKEYHKLKAGEASGYIMWLDATSSGLQVMTALSNCRDTALEVNMINDGTRHDVYSTVRDRMNALLTKKVSREKVKKCLMTHYYNSEAVPKKLLTPTQLEVFYDVIAGFLPGAEEVQDLINSYWDDSVDEYSWTLPDGHIAKVPVVISSDYVIYNEDIGEVPFKVLEQGPSTNYRSLAPNIIHSIDGYVAREMVGRATFPLVHIHDCFGFAPKYFWEVRKLYREIMAEIAESNLLEHILSEISGEKVTLQMEDNIADEIRHSSYMLT